MAKVVDDAFRAWNEGQGPPPSAGELIRVANQAAGRGARSVDARAAARLHEFLAENENADPIAIARWIAETDL